MALRLAGGKPRDRTQLCILSKAYELEAYSLHSQVSSFVQGFSYRRCSVAVQPPHLLQCQTLRQCLQLVLLSSSSFSLT